MPLPCIFTFPCSVYQRGPQFELLNSLYTLLIESKRLNVRWERQAQNNTQLSKMCSAAYISTAIQYHHLELFKTEQDTILDQPPLADPA